MKKCSKFHCMAKVNLFPKRVGFFNFLYLHIHFLQIFSCKIKSLDLWMADSKCT